MKAKLKKINGVDSLEADPHDGNSTTDTDTNLLRDIWDTNDNVSVLGREEGYTVRYTPAPEGKGVYLIVYPESSPNTNSISFNNH